MNKIEVEKLLKELDDYAEEIRNDWSAFDGRDLRNFVCYQWIPNMRKAIYGGPDNKGWNPV